jgi:uncharacterized membrane protein
MTAIATAPWSLVPVVLVLLLPAVVSLARSGRPWITRRGRVVLTGLRVAAIALATLALARPATVEPRPDPVRRALWLIDGSLSVDRGELARAREAARIAARAARAAGVRTDTWVFGDRPAPDPEAGPEGSTAASGRVPVAPPAGPALRAPARSWSRDDTDIEAALAAACRAVLPGERARAFLLSDGNATAGDVGRILPALARAGIEVHVLPLPARPRRGVAVRRVDVPSRAFAGDVVEVGVVVESVAPTAATLLVELDGRAARRVPVSLPAGRSIPRVPVTLGRAGSALFRARIESPEIPDPDADDDEAGGVCEVEPPGRVLVVTSEPERRHPFAAACERQGIEVDTVGPGALGAGDVGSAGLARYSAVVLADAPAAAFPPGALERIRSYVRDAGGGFVMLGSDRTFAPGGYAGTPIESVLPVRLAPARQVIHETAVVLLIDCSGSMSGTPLEAARHAVKAALRKLHGRIVSVFAFADWAVQVVPARRIGGDFGGIDAAIDRVASGGGTAFVPPLEAAAAALDDPRYASRYAIIVTDGMPADAPLLPEPIGRMTRRWIRLSTIGIGAGTDRVLLSEMARLGGGRHHDLQDVARLRTILESEASRLVRGGTTVESEPFSPVIVRRHRVVRGFSNSDLPEVTGFAVTTPKERSEVVIARETGEPIVALWRYGLGIGAAVTTDAGGRWSPAWSRWPGLARLAGQIVKATVPSGATGFRLRARARGRAGDIVVDTPIGAESAAAPSGRAPSGAEGAAGHTLDPLPLAATVTGPDGSRQSVALAQAEPGRHRGAFAATRRGFYRVSVRRGGSTAVVSSGAAFRSPEAELAAHAPDAAALQAIAAATGGRVLAGPDEMLALATSIPAGPPGGGAPEGRAAVVREWWAPLALAALLLFFAEIVLRRSGIFDGSAGGVEAGAGPGGVEAVHLRIAEGYLRWAREYERRGDDARAQECYLDAHSHFRKARRDHEASRMWERYRQIDPRKAGGAAGTASRP